jgi:hypothetical protein
MVYIPPAPKGAFIQIGDYVPKVGIYTNPGIVVEKREDGRIVIDTNKDNIQLYHRHSITNGLTLEEKEMFNSIMDGIMALERNADRILSLQGIIDDLRDDPSYKKVMDTLHNEQAQLIRISKELPRVFQTQPESIR